MTLSIYNFLWGIFKLFLPSYLERRQKKGKEDKHRLKERYGTSKKARPDGTIIWLHGTSVGESVAALALANSMKKHGYGKNKKEFFLLTTNTTSAAKLIKDKYDQSKKNTGDYSGLQAAFANELYVDGGVVKTRKKDSSDKQS